VNESACGFRFFKGRKARQGAKGAKGEPTNFFKKTYIKPYFNLSKQLAGTGG